MQSQAIISQIDVLLVEFSRARAASPHNDLSGGLAAHELASIRTRLRAAIERLAPMGSSYARDAAAASGHDGSVVIQLAGVLTALREDFMAGYLQRIEELVNATLFDDFLEMARELLVKGYKDPAAVISGSVLEEHVRKLAARNNLSQTTPKGAPVSFDGLCIDLVKAGAFSEPQRKILVGWYGQRNAAAHGDYADVIGADVQRMLEGIRDFLVRFPA